MIFLSCDIENFGCLSGFHYDFSEGLNVFHAENGKGKTTFAAFLTAMLYGLGPATRTLAEAEELAYFELAGRIAALPGGAELIGKSVTVHHGEDVLTLTCMLTCIEDIGRVRPIEIAD